MAGNLDGQGRLARVRRLGIATFGLFVVGSVAAWFLRESLAAWLALHAGSLRLTDPSSKATLALALLELSIAGGWVLAVPALAWLVALLSWPATILRAERRGWLYLGLSFALVLTSLLALVRFSNPTPAHDIDPLFYMAIPADEAVWMYTVALAMVATLSAVVVPLFVLMRHHPPEVHRRYAAYTSALLTGVTLTIAQLMLADSLTRGAVRSAAVVVTLGVVVAAPVAILVRRGVFRERRRRAILLSGTGFTLLWFLERWFLVMTVILGLGYVVLYVGAVASGLAVRRWDERRAAR